MSLKLPILPFFEALCTGVSITMDPANGLVGCEADVIDLGWGDMMEVYDGFSFPGVDFSPGGVLSNDVGEVIKESLLIKGDPRSFGKWIEGLVLPRFGSFCGKGCCLGVKSKTDMVRI